MGRPRVVQLGTCSAGLAFMLLALVTAADGWNESLGASAYIATVALYFVVALAIVVVALAAVLLVRHYGGKSVHPRTRILSVLMCTIASAIIAAPVSVRWADDNGSHGVLSPLVAAPFVASQHPESPWGLAWESSYP